MKNTIQIVCVAVIVAIMNLAAMAVNIETVPVGNAGNAGELSGGNYVGTGPDRICGSVNYEYNIGKYEVTAEQYTEFLNSVAGVDPYGLYNANMWVSDYSVGILGCKIERYGGAGSSIDPYQYRVDANWANRPVNYVGWGDAARFVNWLHNGQPTGTLTGAPSQDAGLTEDGAYYLNGATTNTSLLAISREPDWKWAIASEDEWYKAAYYDPNLNAGAGGYYDYPTSNDSPPSNDLFDPDPGNNATFNDRGFGESEFTLGSPYYRTEAGAHENSDSPYGTFDQGGNLWEWNEAIVGSRRGARGGSLHNDYMYGPIYLQAVMRYSHSPGEFDSVGFRVSEVPEPASMAILMLGGIGILRRRKCVLR